MEINHFDLERNFLEVDADAEVYIEKLLLLLGADKYLLLSIIENDNVLLVAKHDIWQMKIDLTQLTTHLQAKILYDSFCVSTFKDILKDLLPFYVHIIINKQIMSIDA